MFGFDLSFVNFMFFRREPLPQILTKTVWSKGEFFRAGYYDELIYIQFLGAENNYEFTLAGI